MPNYASVADIAAIMGQTISDSPATRPTATGTGILLEIADKYINSFLQVSTNISDTTGVLRIVEIKLVQKMINNIFALSDPANYGLIEIELTEEDKTLIHLALSKWDGKSWELGT